MPAATRAAPASPAPDGSLPVTGSSLGSTGASGAGDVVEVVAAVVAGVESTIGNGAWTGVADMTVVAAGADWRPVAASTPPQV